MEPSGHLVETEVTVEDAHGQQSKKRLFYIRLGTRAVEDQKERERYIAQRWGGA